MLHLGGRLFQEYLCVMAAKAERLRLNYLEHNQDRLRCDIYQNLVDATAADDSHGNLGRRCILPASFPGSPRYFHRHYHDALAVVRNVGRPHLFITFTCNPRWQGITAELREGQDPCDRPDIVSRVFALKLAELLFDLTHSHVLGVCVAHFAVIEYQKRGLPHCHILLILADQDRPRDSAAVDELVSAELPSRTGKPHLYRLVKEHMIHGDCAHMPGATCRQGGTCTYGYPKPFQRSTSWDDEAGCPRYRRRSPGHGGETATLASGRTVDNSHVVPFNGLLLSKYAAHINVEVVASMGAVKYLFKYLTKGTPRVMMRLDEPVATTTTTTPTTTTTAGNNGNSAEADEIRQYWDMRCLGALEAVLVEELLAARRPEGKLWRLHRVAGWCRGGVDHLHADRTLLLVCELKQRNRLPLPRRAAGLW